MSAIIKTLKTTTNDVEQSVYPKTVLEAVVDAETNETLDVILDNLNEKIDNIEPGGGGSGGGGTTYELSRADDTVTLTGSDGSSSEVNISDKISNKRIDITGQTIDLNSLTLADGTTDIALYINKTNSGSTNISNVPVGSTPFTLDVELIRWASTTDYISKQVFICSSGKHQFRVRYCTSGTWGDWTTYDFTDVVSKSGDTMTGTLNIESPNFPALKLNRTGTTTNYTAIQFNNDNGMLGGLGMNTPSGDMVVMNEDGVGYPMLDKRNYNQYALPLSGGTVTGATTFSSLLTTSNGSVVARQANEANWGDKGYVVLAKIVVKRKYMSNSNLMLTLSSFGDRTRAEGKIYVQFGNVGTAASTTVLNVSTCGTPAIYYVLTSDTSADTATLELIATKAGYENFAIINISTSSHFRARAVITFPMTFETSLRSGAIAATTYTMLDSDNYSNYAVPKTGGTFTGEVNVKNNVNVLLSGDNTGDTLVPIPTAGTLQKSGDYMTSETGLKAMKSFIGSYYGGTTSATNAWNSVISVRHRNGHSDGVSHGMYLRSLMNRGNADLIWNNQNAGTWENERTILDSRNYSSYALPKAGGTLTGAVKYGSYNMLEYNSTSTTVSNTNRPNMYFGNDNTRTVLRGQVYINNPGVAPCTQVMWAVISDARLKENIIDLTSTDDIKSKYIQLWDKVNPMEYNLTYNSNKKNLGYVAQDFIEAMEELDIDYEESSIVNIQPNEQIGEDGICSVSENSEYFEELYTLNYDECAMLTTLKVKQIVNEILPNMQAEIDALKEQNELLKEQIRLMKEGN